MAVGPERKCGGLLALPPWAADPQHQPLYYAIGAISMTHSRRIGVKYYRRCTGASDLQAMLDLIGRSLGGQFDVELPPIAIGNANK
jgi:hypothetical protein